MINEEMHEVETVNENVETKEEVKVDNAKSTRSFMEEAVAGMVEIRPGGKLDCVVTAITDDGVIVDCKQKKEGFITLDELGCDVSTLSVGDTFKAELIENKSNNKEYLALSKKAFDAKIAEKLQKEQIEKEIESGEFEITISGANSGGLTATKGGYQIFIPRSHVAMRKKNAEPISDEKMKEYVGKTFVVRKLDDKESEQKKGRRRIVASIKDVLYDKRKKEIETRNREREEKIAREKQERIDIFNANADRFKPQFIVPGKVKRFADFGVFVDVYGFRALCPNGEVSWIRGTKPDTVLELNKEYEFLITKVNEEKCEVTLSYKRLQKTPTELAKEKYPIGSIVKGVVQSIVNFGAFVSLEPGVDGLVYKSNVSYDKVEDVNTVLTVGQEIEAKVISFREGGIGLSIKDLLPNPNPQPRTERGEHSKNRAEKNVGEKKSKRNEDSYESQEEKENYETFGGSQAASNHVFSNILGGLFTGNDNGEDDK